MSNEIYSIQMIKSLSNPVFVKYGIESAFVFGSYSRDDATEKSDIDFYIPKLPTKMGISFFAMEEELKSSLGKEVDIITDSSSFINDKIRSELFASIESEKIRIYQTHK